jgi:DNA polymerase III epsilon subunit-like protein
MILFFDVETNGLAKSQTAAYTDIENWPRVIQLAWALCEDNGENCNRKNFIIFPKDFSISEKMSSIHGITIERAEKEGVLINKVLGEFNIDLDKVNRIVAHNIDFDLPVLNAEFIRNKIKTSLLEKEKYCTMKSPEIVAYCKIPSSMGTGFKWPSLSELYNKLFEKSFEDSHNAAADVDACLNCYFELKKEKIIKNHNCIEI